MKIYKILFILLALSGCVQPFSQYYYDTTGGIDITQSPRFIISSEDPQEFRGGDREKDTREMMEDGYALIGYSSFNAGNIHAGGARRQAERVNASVVIVYSKYSNTISGMMPLTLPDTQTSSTSLSGNVYGPGGSATYSGTANTTTYGSRTTYIPYQC